uniref:Methylated-DNA--protein-cysteine methyltransferase n=1 Tax=Sulfurisphaera tokodaii (strain DSM 16993 / JCM 10545 / NBRC 100140 / 7) TaxID=273063 RepID=UPI001C717B8D|nr:Chain A, Methylated-DNA--protein-cysteine methyltransferase [Sulfurisphaera tokodaii str. 7]7E1P_A Chain A, Methylated-DNA--protein-cysteine methyltransferase [Sulfurisphaera tokodaii str. 7]
MIVYGLYKSPFGPITVAKNEKGFVMLDFCDCAERSSLDNDYFTDFFYKLDLYFEGKKVDLTEPVDFKPFNEFRIRVFKEVMRIKWGEVRTYKQVADAVKTSPRAVGTALSKNNVLLIIPSHRVIGEKSLGGYSRGVELKRKLLELEGIDVAKFIEK